MTIGMGVSGSSAYGLYVLMGGLIYLAFLLILFGVGVWVILRLLGGKGGKKLGQKKVKSIFKKARRSIYD